jgi:hypothetical protein
MSLSPMWRSVIDALSDADKATAWVTLQETPPVWAVDGFDDLAPDEKEAVARYMLALIGEKVAAQAWIEVHFPEWPEGQFDMWWTNVREGSEYSSGRLIDALQAIEA